MRQLRTRSVSEAAVMYVFVQALLIVAHNAPSIDYIEEQQVGVVRVGRRELTSLQTNKVLVLPQQQQNAAAVKK